ncbi:GNAT family N-acetyltransferase [Enterococcus casseliflavus]|uniref:GNAT family N-acetyltransferase n=1 Tax=Enterococcus casseliflavus TaxID=37734 RepID=UPI00403CE39A
MTTKERHLLLLAENQRLETPRLLLRPVSLADAADMFAYANDEEATRFVFPKHASLEETKQQIASYFIAMPLGKFGIEEKVTGKLVGTIDLRIDSDTATGELGYIVNRAYWGQGIVPEAAMVLLHFGFETLELIRIFARHDARNPQSGRVMDKIGMKVEMTYPSARNSEITDEIMRGITLEEWKKRIM